MLWTLVGAVLVQWALRLAAAETVFPEVTWAVVLIGAWGLSIAVLGWLAHPRSGASWPRWWRPLPLATALVTVAALAVWTFVQVHANAAYGTDELAFDQYAAQLALHGHNPYAHSMAPAFNLFGVSPDGYTYRLDGSAVTTLSYPALAFELYLPFLALGWSTQLAVVLNVAAWAAAMLLVFLLLPRRLRAAGLLLGSLTTYIAYAAGGVTDMLYLPLLVGACYRWHEFPAERRLRRYAGPVLLGLAMAVKQTPWLVLPFVLGGVALEASAGRGVRAGLRSAGSYVAACAAAFVLPNLPYLLRSPALWLSGVSTPVLGHVVPAGQGVVGFSLFLRVGGGSLADYTALEVVALLGLLAVYLATYPRLRPVTWLMPSVALFFASRSFGSYLIALVPVALVGAISSRAVPQGLRPWSVPSPAPWRHRRVACTLAAVVAAGTLAVTLSARPPLSLHVDSVTTTGQLATVEALEVSVRNRTGRPLAPHFTVDEGGAVTSFWDSSGPHLLPAGASARYLLTSPDFPAQPSLAGGFQVVAFTTSPATVAASPAYVLNRWHVSLVPDALDRPVAVGVAVTVRAQLLDQLDRPVHVGSVPVYLGQVIYDQQGLEYSQAVVNGSSPGQTPVEALTDSHGVATFRIVGTQVTPDPVYFEANLVEPTQFFPYGYSQILAIRFRR